MGISDAAYRQILREYDEKQLFALREQRKRTRIIEEKIPELSVLNSHITELSADMAVMRISKAQKDLKKMEAERKDLIEKRNFLLNSAGFSEKDLRPVYECDICKDTGYAGNEMCSCMKSRITEIYYDQSNIREILKKENFSTFTLKYYSDDPAMGINGESPLSMAKKSLSCAMDFVRDFERTQDNLFISAETGTGKTFLCNCIARAILDSGYSVIYLSSVKLFDIIAGETFSNNREKERTDDIYSCDLLIIDDLGTEFANTFTLSAFFNCINERLLSGRHAIISTNLSLERLREDYSERVFSRIAEKYKFIRLSGEDIRIIKKLEE